MPTLNWIGKGAVVTHHKDAPRHPLMALSQSEPLVLLTAHKVLAGYRTEKVI